MNAEHRMHVVVARQREAAHSGAPASWWFEAKRGSKVHVAGPEATADLPQPRIGKVRLVTNGHAFHSDRLPVPYRRRRVRRETVWASVEDILFQNH